jgi:hypothetical protein
MLISANSTYKKEKNKKKLLKQQRGGKLKEIFRRYGKRGFKE